MKSETTFHCPLCSQQVDVSNVITDATADLQSQVEQLRGELETVSRDRDYIKIYWGDTREALKEEKLIVDRVWKALGISTFEQAKPLSIDEHVESVIKERDHLRTALEKCVVALESIRDFNEDSLFDDPGCIAVDALAATKPLLNKP